MFKGRSNRLIVLVLAALVGSTISWAATAGFTSISISPRGSLSGQIANVTALSGTFSVTQGKAQKVAGVELFKITMGVPEYSHLINVSMAILNPEEIERVLINPGAYIDVQVWYPGSGDGFITINDGGNQVNVVQDTATKASARLSGIMGAALLQPSRVNQTTYYILASITTSGGLPPGQQEQLFNLRFWIDVRL